MVKMRGKPQRKVTAKEAEEFLIEYYLVFQTMVIVFSLITMK